MGRFLEPDPIGFFGGVNFYAYVGNCPVNFVDPWGWCGEKKPNNKILIGAGIALAADPIPGDELLLGLLVPIAAKIVDQTPDELNYIIFTPIEAMVADAFIDWISDGWTYYKEHNTNKSPSKLPTHEKGVARKNMDRPGGEKGDKRRDPFGKRPYGWKGPWPQGR